MMAVNEDWLDCQSFVIGKSTLAGLVSGLSEGDAMLVSSEVYEIFNKMLKIWQWRRLWGHLIAVSVA